MLLWTLLYVTVSFAVGQRLGFRITFWRQFRGGFAEEKLFFFNVC